jgi:hypothetical protein
MFGPPPDMAPPAGQQGDEPGQPVLLRIPRRKAKGSQPFGHRLQRIARHAQQQPAPGLAGQRPEFRIVGKGRQRGPVEAQLAVGHRACGPALVEEGAAPLGDERGSRRQGGRWGRRIASRQVQQPRQQQVQPRKIGAGRHEGRVEPAECVDRGIAQGPLVDPPGGQQLAPLGKRQAGPRAEPFRAHPHGLVEGQILEPGQRVDRDRALQRPDRRDGPRGEGHQPGGLGPGEDGIERSNRSHHVHLSSPLTSGCSAPALMKWT